MRNRPPSRRSLTPSARGAEGEAVGGQLRQRDRVQPQRSSRVSSPVRPRWTRSRVPAMAPRWMPSPVVPPWRSAMSASRASWQYVQAPARRPGEDPAVDEAAEGGAVAGAAAGSSRRCAAPGLVVQAVPQPAEELLELAGREEVAEHEHVGLLGGLVAVDRVALGLQDPVEAADVAVPVPVGVPVQFGEVAVAVELADDARRGRAPAAARETSSQRGELAGVEHRCARTAPAARFGKAPQDVQGAGEHPGGGDVGVRVVVQARVGRRRGSRRGTRRVRPLRGSGSAPGPRRRSAVSAQKRAICSSISAPLVCRNSVSPLASQYCHTL